MPTHIECSDNSNFQGSYPSSACVVFKNGKPLKSEYRHFNIKSVDKPELELKGYLSKFSKLVGNIENGYSTY